MMLLPIGPLRALWSHNLRDMTRKIQARESRENARRDPVWAGLAGNLCTPQTQLTTSSNLVVSAACSALSEGSFSGSPFTSEGGRKAVQIPELYAIPLEPDGCANGERVGFQVGDSKRRRW
jgi:hypothetical protein